MTNYYFPSHRTQQPVQSQDTRFTRELRQNVAQRKAKRKAVLNRVQAQRARTYRRLVKNLKAA